MSNNTQNMDPSRRNKRQGKDRSFKEFIKREQNKQNITWTEMRISIKQ